MVDIEDLDETELDALGKFYQRLSDIVEEDKDIHCSHFIDAAGDLQEQKQERLKSEKINPRKRSIFSCDNGTH